METTREFSHVAHLPQFPGPSVVTRRNASEDPDQATAETVDRMQAAAIEDSSSQPVRSAVRSALRGIPVDSGRLGICNAVYQWTSRNIRFVQDDPILSAILGLDNELDLLIRPARLLTMTRPAEDCDGFTMLCCSMLLAAEIPCEIITIKADPDEPEHFSHVYAEAQLEDGSRVVMDCSQAAQHGYPLGWEAPHYYERRGWGLLQPVEKHRNRLHGLGIWGEALGGGDGGDLLSGSGGGSWLDDLGPAYTGPGSVARAGIDYEPLGGGYGGSGSVWGGIAQLFGPGLTATLRNATLPPGYAIAPNGAIVPAGSLSLGFGAISPTMLLLGGGVLLLVLLKK